MLHISAGKLTRYPGDYQYYLDKSEASSERAALTAGKNLTNAQPVVAGRVEARAGASATGYKPGLREQKAQKRAEAEMRKMLAKQQRERERHVRELEMHIAALEVQQKKLALELENPAVYEAGGRA